ncbi:hypothetical protein [Enterococcus sp. 5H]|uniref:hypothetical protein n=1 Tax=Enterococcus sp. 5H TaxID=1229490 RepID=UPI0023033227|nr:hypothetical protein [Enterococcus sp. 5H]MDA9470584.1 hypothetical protein [Enterococcus sp. 5H]
MLKKFAVPIIFLGILTGCASTTDPPEVSTTSNELSPPVELITQEEVENAQSNWAQALISIGEAEDPKHRASEVIDNLYNYQDGTVLFKPTKASDIPFRETKEDALSYFVGGKIDEDNGFALEPWADIRFDNHNFILREDTASAAGIYYFTSKKTGEETKVEYTFGYTRDDDGNLRIEIQHSSLPFSS